MERKVGWVRDAAGDRFGGLRFNAPLMDVVTGPDARALARAAVDQMRGGDSLAAWTAELTEEDLLESPHYLFGTVDDMVDHLRACHHRWGISSWSLLGRTTADVAPVIEKLG
jgi:hypothetical protein